MKTLSQLLTLAACLLIAMAATAQNGIKAIKITITYNYNMPTQQPATFLFNFEPGGNDALANPDQGGASNISQLNLEVYPFSITTDQQIITSLDARSELNAYRSIPFGFVCKQTGDIKVVAEVFSLDPFTPVPDFVWLEQISTGERYSILDTTKFTLPANPNFLSDFILHTGPKAISGGISETCYGMADGAVLVNGPEYPGFTLEFLDPVAPAVPIFTAVVAGMDTLVDNLAPGNYVSVIRINGIPVDSADVTVNAAAFLVADFVTDYNAVIPGTTVNFTDNSSGTGITYLWDFGTGDSSTTAGSESYPFANTGVYTVNLLVTDVNGCTASVSDVITVDNPPMMNNPFNGNYSSFNSGGSGHQYNPEGSPTYMPDKDAIAINNQRITIGLSSEASSVSIVAMNGAVVYSGAQNSTTAEYSIPGNGAYIVTIEHNDGSVQSTTVVVQ